MSAQAFTIKKEDCSVVALGNFPPLAFSRQWFTSAGLLTDEDFEGSEDTKETQVIADEQIAIIKTRDFVVQAEPQRLVFLAKVAHRRTPIRDLALETIRSFENCPLSAVGLNLDLQIEFASPSDKDSVFSTFVTTSPWASHFESPSPKSVVVSGTRNMDDSSSRNIDVRVVSITDTLLGFHVNQHLQLESRDPAVNVPLVTEALMKDWQPFLKFAHALAASACSPHP